MKKTQRVFIAIEPELKNKADKFAKSNHITLSQLIRNLLRETIKNG